MGDMTIDVTGSDPVKKKKKRPVEVEVKKKKKKRPVEVEVKKKKKKRPVEVDVDALPVGKDNYIIVKHGSKNVLALAFNPERNRCVIDLKNGEQETLEYDSTTLIANLGPTPAAGGKAFGVTIMPLIGSTQTPSATINYYREMSELDNKAFNSALRRAHKTMEDLSLDTIFPVGMINLKPKRGKYAGMYTYKRKGEEVLDSIDLFPPTFEDRAYNEYVLLHEYAHAVWYRLVNRKNKSRWVALFQSRIEQVHHRQKQMDVMLKELLDSQETVKEFERSLDEDMRTIFKEVVQHYKRYHRLDIKSMDLLLEEDSVKFASLWPRQAVAIQSVRTDISEYASTCPEEFFAEAFAYHVTGKTLAKDVTKLIKYTVKQSAVGE